MNPLKSINTRGNSRAKADSFSLVARFIKIIICFCITEQLIECR